MRFIASFIGVLVALALLVVSAYFNYQFMLGQGKTLTDGQFYGAASVAMDIFKGLAPFFFYWAYRSGRYFISATGFATWILFSAFSLISAIGYSAENRAAVSGSKEAITATYNDATNELNTAKEKRKQLGQVQPIKSVANKLNALKQSKRWTTTKGCTDATIAVSREFCTNYFEVKGTMAAAVEVERLDSKIDKLQGEVNALRKRGAGGESDPQIGILARLSGATLGTVKTSLITFIAVLIEIGSSLGLFLATSHSEIFGRNKKARELKKATVATDFKEGTMQQVQDNEGDVTNYVGVRILFKKGSQTMVQDMYYGYCAWCQTHGYKPLNPIEFDEDIAFIVSNTSIEKDGNLCNGLYFTEEPLQAIA